MVFVGTRSAQIPEMSEGTKLGRENVYWLQRSSRPHILPQTSPKLPVLRERPVCCPIDVVIIRMQPWVPATDSAAPHAFYVDDNCPLSPQSNSEASQEFFC